MYEFMNVIYTVILLWEMLWLWYYKWWCCDITSEILRYEWCCKYTSILWVMLWYYNRDNLPCYEWCCNIISNDVISWAMLCWTARWYSMTDAVLAMSAVKLMRMMLQSVVTYLNNGRILIDIQRHFSQTNRKSIWKLSKKNTYYPRTKSKSKTNAQTKRISHIIL